MDDFTVIPDDGVYYNKPPPTYNEMYNFNKACNIIIHGPSNHKLGMDDTTYYYEYLLSLSHTLNQQINIYQRLVDKLCKMYSTQAVEIQKAMNIDHFDATYNMSVIISLCHYGDLDQSLYIYNRLIKMINTPSYITKTICSVAEYGNWIYNMFS